MAGELEWIGVWDSETLKVVQIKRGDRSIYTLSNPLNDDVINIEGKELLSFCEKITGKIRRGE